MENLDWGNLGFGYRKTNYNVRCYYRNGKWGEIEVSSEETIPMHMAATCLHYGQEAFEGLKAYRCPDGRCACSVPTRTLHVCSQHAAAYSCQSCLRRSSMRWSIR